MTTLPLCPNTCRASGNAYSHLTFEEFSARFLGALPAKQTQSNDNTASPTLSNRKLRAAPPAPRDYVNWVEAGKVTPIRTQGGCSECPSAATLCLRTPACATPDAEQRCPSGH